MSGEVEAFPESPPQVIGQIGQNEDRRKKLRSSHARYRLMSSSEPAPMGPRRKQPHQGPLSSTRVGVLGVNAGTRANQRLTRARDRLRRSRATKLGVRSGSTRRRQHWIGREPPGRCQPRSSSHPCVCRRRRHPRRTAPAIPSSGCSFRNFGSASPSASTPNAGEAAIGWCGSSIWLRMVLSPAGAVLLSYRL